jgi:4-hydroxy-3-polyprenylbenzoate decarboxylase
MSMSRIIVAITGASGAVYGLAALDMLRALGVETHLIVSKSGALTLEHETGLTLAQVRARADVTHAAGDIGAACSSGSFATLGMLVAPCSVKSLAEIATGVSSSLVTRAADVTLKERRRLVLMLRETPLTLAHIRNMETVTLMGGVIAPPVPAFYTRPASLDDLVAHSVGRALDLFGLDTGTVRRWNGLKADQA